MRLAPCLIVASLALAAAPAARAAESYDNCTGFIASLPAVISTQGTWCLDKDLSTATSSGNVLTINTNNVTLDCNHFKFGGLAAGTGTLAVGVYSVDRSNITVRNCNIRGFMIGTSLTGASAGGNLVEDNRFEANTFTSVRVGGSAGMVRRNSILDTGNSLNGALINAYGIWTTGDVDVIDNTIVGVTSSTGAGAVNGVVVDAASGATIAGNRIRGLDSGALGSIVGVQEFSSQRVIVRDNHLVQFEDLTSQGVSCSDDTSVAVGNVINGFLATVMGCTDGGNTNIP